MLPCVEEYVNYLAVEKGLSENTLASYVRDLEKYEKFIANTENEVDLEMLEDADIFNADQSTVSSFIESLMKSKMAPTSVCRTLSSIRGLYKFLVRERLCKSDPTSNIAPPKRQRVVFTGSKQASHAVIIHGSGSACNHQARIRRQKRKRSGHAGAIVLFRSEGL